MLRAGFWGMMPVRQEFSVPSGTGTSLPNRVLIFSRARPPHATHRAVIIDRYLVREVLATLLGVVAVLLLILLSVRLVRLFAEAAAGNLPVDVILIALGLKSIANLVFVLPLALYLAVLLTLIRLHKDSEMAAMAACGIGAGRVLRPLSWLALVFAVLTGALGLLQAIRLREGRPDTGYLC